jgi:hypothetical protein
MTDEQKIKALQEFAVYTNVNMADLPAIAEKDMTTVAYKDLILQ